MDKFNNEFNKGNKKLLGAKKKLHSLQKKPNKSDQLRIHEKLVKNFKKTLAQEKQKDTRKYAVATKPEKQVKEILIKNKIEFEREYEIMGKFFDFAIFSKGVDGKLEIFSVIEVHGEYWHGSDEKYSTNELSLMMINNKINDFYKKTISSIKELYQITVFENEINEKELIEEIKYAETLFKNKIKKDI